MRILLDECVPRRLRQQLSDHDVRTVAEVGWAGRKNGELLQLMSGQGFEVLLTVDQSIRHQQNLRARRISLVVLTGSTKWSLVRHHADRIAALWLPRRLAVTSRSRFPSSRSNGAGSIHVCGQLGDGRKSLCARGRMLVSRLGIEPRTRRLRVCCSAN